MKNKFYLLAIPKLKNEQLFKYWVSIDSGKIAAVDAYSINGLFEFATLFDNIDEAIRCLFVAEKLFPNTDFFIGLR